MFCRMWLTQRMPSDWRPSTRATVEASQISLKPFFLEVAKVYQ